MYTRYRSYKLKFGYRFQYKSKYKKRRKTEQISLELYMKKITITLLLFLIIINSLSYCFAFDIGTKDLISLGECERLLTHDGIPVKTTYVVYQKDGINYPAYCLDKDLPGIEAGSYSVNGSSKLQNVEVWRAIINGFPYKSIAELGAANEQEAFTATKQAVYTMLYGRDTSSYGAVNSDAGRRTYQIYLNIINSARNSNENIINDLQVSISSNSENWEIDSFNKNYVSKVYKLNSNINLGNYKIELQGEIPENTIITDMNNNTKNTFNIGENFKILIPIQKLLNSGKFTIRAHSNLQTKPVVYGSTTVPGRQNYALTGYMYEEKDATLEEQYFKNITKIIVIKKEYGNEKRLNGVKFNLLDADKKIVKENLITDENGEIVLENMVPGFYYLQETETLENYNLYTDLIEIKLDLNEEFQATVNNTLKTVTEIDKNFEKVEVKPTFEETIYNAKTTVKKLPVTGC